jgi:hypothetical protein
MSMTVNPTPPTVIIIRALSFQIIRQAAGTLFIFAITLIVH